jgi:hypothetical protein
LVTVNTVPRGRVWLAHVPGPACGYHVACPRSLFDDTGADGVTTVVGVAVVGVVVTGSVVGVAVVAGVVAAVDVGVVLGA